jgi:hypothetical protein
MTSASTAVQGQRSKDDIPSQELHGRHVLAPVFDNLNQYEATTHFKGQSTVVLDGDKSNRRELLSGALCISA